MYNKLFTKILDSSIWLEPDQHRLVWITLIAAMDRDGVTQFACAENLAARARVSVESCEKAIAAFEAPDPHDPTQEYEGRRIERIPGGWLVLNAEKYREMVTAAVASAKSRERMKRYRDKKKEPSNADVTPCYALLRSVTPSGSDAVSESVAHKEPYAVLEAIKIGYPAGTFGDQNWILAERTIGKLLDAGESEESLVAAALAYREQMDAKGSTGTQFIRSPEKFYGDGFWRGPFPKPAPKKSLSDNLTWTPKE